MRDLIYENFYTAESPEELFLMHHGIKGQKWYHRRFQNEDGSLTAAGRARYLTGKAKDYVSKKYEEHKEASKVKKEKRDADNLKKAIDEGDYKAVNKYKSKMTTAQLQEAINRVRLTTQLNSLAPRKTSLIDNVTRGMQTISNVTNSVNNAVRGIDNFKKTLTERNQSDYDKSINQARNDAIKDARDSLKKKGYSLEDQERAARGAAEAFDKAVKDSDKNSKDRGSNTDFYSSLVSSGIIKPSEGKKKGKKGGGDNDGGDSDAKEKKKSEGKASSYNDSSIKRHSILSSAMLSATVSEATKAKRPPISADALRKSVSSIDSGDWSSDWDRIKQFRNRDNRSSGPKLKSYSF